MCKITSEIYQKLYGEEKYRAEHWKLNGMVYVRFRTRTGPARELWPKPSHSERRPVPHSGTYLYVGGDDDDDNGLF